MAKSAQKFTPSPSQDIPFDKLVLSQYYVRRIKAGISVEELAEDIARRGLLQSLSVRPVLSDDGPESRQFEITAGGRRFSALHPLDQFRAFVEMLEKGQGDEEIATAFFVTPQVVKQHLKLDAVIPALLEIYAKDEMTLEQLMAFTVNPDHERQVKIWDAMKSSWNKEPYPIRRTLTETSVWASDRHAVFVALKAYETAGGTMFHDPFQNDDGGAAHAKLRAERRVLEEEYEGQDEFPEEIDARLGELEVAME